MERQTVPDRQIEAQTDRDRERHKYSDTLIAGLLSR